MAALDMNQVSTIGANTADILAVPSGWRPNSTTRIAMVMPTTVELDMLVAKVSPDTADKTAHTEERTVRDHAVYVGAKEMRRLTSGAGCRTVPSATVRFDA